MATFYIKKNNNNNKTSAQLVQSWDFKLGVDHFNGPDAEAL